MTTPAPLAWTPPSGMEGGVAAGWRTFYRHIADAYQITPQRYRDLYVAQHGCCYICRKATGVNPDDPRGRGSRRLAVDHNHSTGRVRGLLCSGGDRTCNRIIGWLTVDALRRAVRYVETEPASIVRAADLDSADDRDALLRSVLNL